MFIQIYKLYKFFVFINKFFSYAPTFSNASINADRKQNEKKQNKKATKNITLSTNGVSNWWNR